MMPRFFSLLMLALAMAATARGQLPQFSSTSFDDWIYSNQAVELNSDNILANRIYLYVSSSQKALTLTSPTFTCRSGYILDMQVTWITDQWLSEGFEARKTALTATLLDPNGVSVDSVTFTPREVSRTNNVHLTMAVPSDLPRMKLRFAAWKADVKNSGAVRQIQLNAMRRGDLNRDGSISIADINVMIAMILDAGSDDVPLLLADMNDDGSITVADVNLIIDMILR